MSSYLYTPIGYAYTVYEWSANWLHDWIETYVYQKRQPPKITYIRCFKCHSGEVLNKCGPPDDIKSKYCHECYQALLKDVMQSILVGFK